MIAPHPEIFMGHKLAIREINDVLLQPLFNSVVADSDYGILVTDLDHSSLMCNHRFGEIWGVDISRVVEASVTEVRDYVNSRVVDLQTWQNNLDEIYCFPKAEQIDELTLRNPHMTLRRFTGPILGSDGEVLGRLWTFLDVTREVKRRKMLEALHAAGTLMDADPQNVYQGLVDQVGNYLESWAFLSVLKGDYLEFRCVGGHENPAREVPGNDLRDSFCQFCIDSNEPFVIQDVNEQPQLPDVLPKRVGFTRYAGVPIKRSNGEVIGTLCILDSRSEIPVDEDDIRYLSQVATRIAGELEREEYLDQLEQSLNDTQGSLDEAQQRLVQSEKLAITGTLAASIAHDIRNILASMQLHLQNSGKSPEKRLELLNEQMTRFKVLSHRLLSYSRPTEPLLEQVNVHETLLEAVGLLEPQAELHQIEINFHLDADDAWMMGDKVRLEHLFVNLILNAIQALERGGLVTVATRNDEGGMIIEISDDGPGVNADYLEQMYVPFSSSKPDGFGLGLYSCREIVRTHGADLRCVSAPGEGTRFSMAFRRMG